MNLRGMANSLTQRVNPNIEGVTFRALPPTTALDGTRTPAWEAGTAIMQVQGISGNTLNFVAEQNIQGTLRQVFLYGYWQGVNAAAGTGGDVFRFPEYDGGPLRDWKVVHVLSYYNDWTKAIVQMQSAMIADSEWQ